MNRGRSVPGNANLFSTAEGRVAESNRRLLEEQNDKKTSDLADSIEKLKLLSIDIHAEVDDQNRLLSHMGKDMGTASSMLNDTLGQLGNLFNTGESKHAAYLIAFVVSAFVVLYIFFYKLPASSETESGAA